MKQIPTIRIFVSSPGDVGKERELCHKMITRLGAEFSARCVLDPVMWEHEPLRATDSFQQQIVRPSQTQIVICILWSRLGTRLPENLLKPNGERYASGTEFEYLDAQAAYAERKEPDLLIYKKDADPLISGRDVREARQRLEQLELLNAFIQQTFFYPTGELRVAFHCFTEAEEFEAKIELHLRKLLLERFPEQPEVEGDVLPVWDIKNCPFPGLRSFQFEDEPYFFGREKELNGVLDALSVQAAGGTASVIILGHSGSGKSSLARAGVMPRLVQPGVIEGIGLWRRAIWPPPSTDGEPRRHPLAELAAALQAPDALPALAAADAAELAELLAKKPEQAVGLIQGALRALAVETRQREGLAEMPRPRLALLVDQMEEIYSRPEVTEEARGQFVAALVSLARSGCVFVLATLRADFLARTSDTPGFDVLKAGRGIYEIGTPGGEALGAMIRHPTAVAGLRFETSADSRRNLGDTLRDEAIESGDALPLLQFTLAELFAKRRGRLLTFEAYERLGGVCGALRSHADAALVAVSGAGEGELDEIAAACATLAPGADARPVRLRAMKAQFTGATLALVTELEQRRLLIATRDAEGRPAVTLAHEALLTHWPPLAAAVERQRVFLARRGRVRAAVATWIEGNRASCWLSTSGQPLRDAQAFLRSTNCPDADELAFLKASVKAAQRRRMVRGAITAGLLAASLVAYLWISNQSERNLAVVRSEKDEKSRQLEFQQKDERLRTERIAALRQQIADQSARCAELLSNPPTRSARQRQRIERDDQPDELLGMAISLAEAGRALATEAPTDELAWRARAEGLLATWRREQELESLFNDRRGPDRKRPEFFPWSPVDAQREIEATLDGWEKISQPPAAEYFRLRGEMKRFVLQDPAGAAADFQTFLSAADRSTDGARRVLELLSEDYEAAEKWGEMEDALRRRLELGEQPALRVKRIRAQFAQRKWQAARAEIENLFITVPGDPAVRAASQELERVIGKLAAIEEIEGELRRQPTSPEALWRHAVVLREAGQWSVARDSLVVLRDRVLPQAQAVAIQLSLIELRLKKNNEDDSPSFGRKVDPAELDRLFKLDLSCAQAPNDIEVHAARLSALMKLQQFKLQLEEADRLIERIPQAAIFQYHRGVALERTGSFAASLAAFEELARLDQQAMKKAYFWDWVALVFEKLERFEEAAQALGMWIQIAPAKEPYQRRAAIYGRLKRTAEAQRDRDSVAEFERASVVVTEVIPGGQAERIGMQVGDVIERYAGQKVITGNQLIRVIGETKTNTSQLEVLRGSARLRFSVQMGPLGVRIQDRSRVTSPAPN